MLRKMKLSQADKSTKKNKNEPNIAQWWQEKKQKPCATPSVEINIGQSPRNETMPTQT